ncbi:hypothetical protein ACTG9Q_02610 [Actinokineospora sp. 24-640]
MSDERELKRLLDLAVGQEPPLRLDPEAVLGEGRRRLRARRAAAVGGAATAVAALVIGVAAVAGSTYGMPGQVGPAGSVTVDGPGPRSGTETAAPVAEPTRPVPGNQAPPPSLTTARNTPPTATVPAGTVLSPAAVERLGAALRDGKVEWPALAKEGQGRPWHAFDRSGTARFDLVTPERARRTVVVTVSVGRVYESELCVSHDNGPPCETWRLGDGTMLTFTNAPEAADSSPTSRLRAVRPDGLVVVVMDVGGSGPPWRRQPLLDQTAMVQIATLPGFGVN